VTIEPSEANGLRARSQIMADKPVTVRRERVGQSVGRLTAPEVARLNVALAFVMGLADEVASGELPKGNGSGDEEQLAGGPAALHVGMGFRGLRQRIFASDSDLELPFRDPVEQPR